MEKAEIQLAVRDIADTLQKMASDLSCTTVDDVPSVVERIKASYGVNVGNKFGESITAQLNELTRKILETKSNIDDETFVISGDASASEISNDMEDDDTELDLDAETETEPEEELTLDLPEEPELGRRVKENKEYDESGRGKFKVTYVFPDGKNIDNDRFEDKAEAMKFKKDLEKKGYKDVVLGEAIAENVKVYPIVVKRLMEKCSQKEKTILENMYDSGSTQRKKVMELARKAGKK